MSTAANTSARGDLRVAPNVGIIVPSVNTVCESELHLMAATTLRIETTRVMASDDLSAGSIDAVLAEMDSQIEEAAECLRTAAVTVIAYCCTSGSFFLGPQSDRAIVERICRGSSVKATTTATASIAAIRALKLRSVSIVTPYVGTLNDRLVRFLNDAGIRVVGIETAGNIEARANAAMDSGTICDLAVRANIGTAEGCYIACTNVWTADVIENLETNILRKPVISANQATLWHLLELAGSRPPIAGYGQLLADAP